MNSGAFSGDLTQYFAAKKLYIRAHQNNTDASTQYLESITPEIGDLMPVATSATVINGMAVGLDAIYLAGAIIQAKNPHVSSSALKEDLYYFSIPGLLSLGATALNLYEVAQTADLTIKSEKTAPGSVHDDLLSTTLTSALWPLPFNLAATGTLVYLFIHKIKQIREANV